MQIFIDKLVNLATYILLELKGKCTGFRCYYRGSSIEKYGHRLNRSIRQWARVNDNMTINHPMTRINFFINNLNYFLVIVRIHPDNYADLARKHCTSKLSSFDDLRSIGTFGFRGEALNSLCELSGNFHVSTKQESESIGTTLQYAKHGRFK